MLEYKKGTALERGANNYYSKCKEKNGNFISMGWFSLYVENYVK